MTAQGPAVLIGGVPRVGKSRLARTIAALTGFEVIHCDEFRKTFWSTADERERLARRYGGYEQAIATRRKGLIIEGDDLISRNRGDPVLARQGLISNDHELTLDLMMHLQARTGARAYVAGCVEAESETVLAAIRRHETDICFTRELPDAGVRGFIRTSIKRSERLRAMATEARITYLEMGKGDFDTAIEMAARRTLDDLGWPDVRAAGSS